MRVVNELVGGIGFLRFGQCSMGWSLVHTLHLWKALKDSKLALSHVATGAVIGGFHMTSLKFKL